MIPGKKGNLTAAKRSATQRRNPSVEELLGMVDMEPIASAGELTAASESHADSGPAKASGPRVGRVTGIDSQGRPLLAYVGMPKPAPSRNASAKPRAASDEGIPARSTVRVTAADAGREALIAFENGDLGLPIVTGLLQAPEEMPARIEVQAGKELVLKCGPASITLTKDGRIVIRGADVLTRSSGSNRIKGGSVHIN